jgi:hypothetical protein
MGCWGVREEPAHENTQSCAQARQTLTWRYNPPRRTCVCCECVYYLDQKYSEKIRDGSAAANNFR